MKNLRYGWRSLRRSPVFLMAAVVTLALGVGATAAIFSLFYQVLLAQLPVAKPAQLVALHSSGGLNGWSSSDNYESVFSYPMYRHLRDESGALLSGLVARASGAVDITHAGQANRAMSETVSGNFFAVLGVKPFAGRLLTPQDDTVRGGNHVGVLGYAYWQKNYGGNTGVVGQTLLVNGHPIEIVGITPPEFRGILSGRTPELYLPISMRGVSSPGFTEFDDSSNQWLTVIGRLRSGISLAAAQAALNPLFTDILRDELDARKIRSAHSRERLLGIHVELHPAQAGLNQLEQSWRKPLMVLFLTAGGLLLIACSNLASLFMVRAAARGREMAVRRALGATRLQLVWQLLTEGGVITALGAVLGIVLSLALTRGIVGMLPEDTAGGWVGTVLNGSILAFTLGISILSCLAFALFPAWYASGADTTGSLKMHARQAGLGEARWRKGLVVLEIALCLVLLAGGGLFLKSFAKLVHHNPGFHTENLLTFTLDPALNGETMGQSLNVFAQLRDRLSQSPGVTAVSFSHFGPYSNNGGSTNVSVEGYKIAEDENTDASVNAAAPNYFRTLGVPLLRGREFTDGDVGGGRKVTVVNQAFVRRFLRGRDPLGVRITKGAGDVVPDTAIVGVVPDAQFSSLRETPIPAYYLPFAQSAKPNEVAEQAVFLVRTNNGDAALPAAVRHLVASLDPDLPVTDMNRMQVQIENSVSQDRAVAVLTSASGVLALLFSSLALYGVIAYAVTRRTAEIGIRMALGADRKSVVGLVLGEVLWLVAFGAAAGIVAAYAVGRSVASELYAVEAVDPTIFAGSVLLLLFVAAIAGASPTLRATRVDPIEALRTE